MTWNHFYLSKTKSSHIPKGDANQPSLTAGWLLCNLFTISLWHQFDRHVPCWWLLSPWTSSKAELSTRQPSNHSCCLVLAGLTASWNSRGNHAIPWELWMHLELNGKKKAAVNTAQPSQPASHWLHRQVLRWEQTLALGCPQEMLPCFPVGQQQQVTNTFSCHSGGGMTQPLSSWLQIGWGHSFVTATGLPGDQKSASSFGIPRHLSKKNEKPA